MLVKILNNVSYQTLPQTPDMVEVDNDLLKRIGVDKQFDDDGNVIDYIDTNKKIILLDNWFEKDYRKYCEMFTRRKAFGIEDVIEDEFRNRTGENAYHNLIELYEEAELVASEIKKLKENMEV